MPDETLTIRPYPLRSMIGNVLRIIRRPQCIGADCVEDGRRTRLIGVGRADLKDTASVVDKHIEVIVFFNSDAKNVSTDFESTTSRISPLTLPDRSNAADSDRPAPEFWPSK